MYLTRRNQGWLPSVFNDFFDTEFLPKASCTAPAINVIEKQSEYDVELAAPGMTKDDFKVTLDEDENLVVAIEKKTENEQKQPDDHYLRREFNYSSFQQTLLLPDDVDREKIAATCEHGVLKVVLPKVKPEELKKESKVIEIQ